MNARGPDCPLRARGCGGCPLLGLPYPEQLARKQARVAAFFPGALPILGMKQPFHYRNKVISTFAQGNGGLVSGLYGEGSHRVLPVDSCLLHDERADAIVRAVREVLNRHGAQAFDEDRGTGLLRHLLVRRARRTGQALVTLVTAAPGLPRARDIALDIADACPDVVSVVHNVNPRRTSAVLGFRERALLGPGHIEDGLCGRVFRLSSRSFYQVNSAQAERLYRLAVGMAALTGRESVIDAYCGIGAIGILAAGGAKEATGIESNAEALKDARINADRNGVGNIRFLLGDAGLALRRMEGPADAVFLDPPRAGCSPEFLEALCRRAPEGIVYISCDVLTQARDVRRLEQDGYRVLKVRPVDMFPHTEHVETVVSMARP